MVNFLSKFLSQKDDGSMTATESGPPPVNAETTSAPADPVQAPEPGPVLARERPVHHMDPHGGMPVHPMPGPGGSEEFEAIAGEELPPGTDVADEDAVVDALRTVYDPEIPVNIYDLGLIYAINIADNGNVDVEMSLTAPGCPVAGDMPGMVSNAVVQVDGIGVCTTRLVWEPAWTMDRMSEDAKLALGMF